ncbi:hypothetical protein BCIN_07g03320 [Botrytis cinerea B05.10]|uniref:Uncharacterized protein n=1 Tax=Botryotinia fuckeliana (strain B05.10) TaxID=332648 RepID=A0A384JMD8_BOTFB|nr:hypothetical protein BCIN_07g03320 [Botrytis cinerea B05.10]ATZ51748.1 hypothetical protein BCIN_07g03320 [Botrytis cinerea B05.10]
MTILFSNDWNTPLLRFISLYSSRLDVHQMPLAGTEAPRLYIPSIKTWPLPICLLPTFPRSLFNLKHHSPSSVYFYNQSLCQLQVRHTYWDRIMSKLSTRYLIIELSTSSHDSLSLSLSKRNEMRKMHSLQVGCSKFYILQ